MLKVLVPLGIIAAYLYKKGTGVQNLDTEVVGVSVYRVTLPANVELRIGIRFNNPSSQNFTVNSVRLNIKQDGTLLGDVYANEPFTIAPGTQTTVPFPVSVRGGAVIMKLLPLLMKKQLLPSLDVAGFMTVEGVEAALSPISVPLAPYDVRRPTTTTTTPATPRKPAAPKVPAKAPVKAAPKRTPQTAAPKRATAHKKLSTNAPRR